MANLTECSAQIDRDSSFQTNSILGSNNETSPHYSCGYELNPNNIAAQKIKNPFVEMRANSSTSTIDLFGMQQQLGCLSIPEEAQHYDISPLLSCVDKSESRKRPDFIMINHASENCESNSGANLLGSLQSPPTVLGDANFQLTYPSVRNRPRTANICIVPHDPAVIESNCTDEPTLLESSLKRLRREELERIIMGHMAGYVTVYKPYADMERELESWKEKVERFRRKNDLLNKEVADLRIVVKSFVTQSAPRFERPIKRYRSVGVQVKPSTTADNVKFEENDLQARSIPTKSETSRSVRQRETHVSYNPQFQTNRERSPIAARQGTNISQEKCKETVRINRRPRCTTNKSEDAKTEGDDLMVMFVKPSNHVPVCESATVHTHRIPSSSIVSEHPSEAMLPKPVVTVTKTIENSMPAIRISWKIPEKQCYAKAVSYCVFLFKEGRTGFRESWNPVTGDISRMSFTFRLGRPEKLRSSYQFKVRAIDVQGRHSPFSDVVVANFP